MVETNLTYILWWIGIVVFFVMIWQIAKSLQSVAVTFRKFEEFVKKFENFKITELPPASPSAAPIAPVAPAPAVVQPVAPVSASAPAPAASDSIPGEIVAVIAAAVDAVIAGPHRILSISPAEHHLGGPNPFQTALAWSAEGRRHIFQSHKLR